MQSPVRTLIIQAWVTCSSFGQLIIARKRSHCRNIVVLSNLVNKGVSSGKAERTVPFKGGFWEDNEINRFVLQRLRVYIFTN